MRRRLRGSLPLLSMLTRRASAPSSLLTGLVAYWKLDEAATGPRADSGSNTLTLTDTGTTPAAAGKISNAASLNGSSRYLSRAHNALLAFGNTDYTFGLWFNQSGETVGVHPLIGKGGAPGTSQDYLVYCYTGGVRFHSYAGTEAAFLGNAEIAVAPAGWNYLTCWQDVTANTLNIQINNGTPVTVTRTGAAVAAAGTLYLGAGFGATILYAGLLDEVGMWSRVLTAGERTALWNGGAGRTHPFT